MAFCKANPQMTHELPPPPKKKKNKNKKKTRELCRLLCPDYLFDENLLIVKSQARLFVHAFQPRIKHRLLITFRNNRVMTEKQQYCEPNQSWTKTEHEKGKWEDTKL